ncbi:hypothetical protein BaRGS_00032644 [Batillaria attramentaria]|uniref:Uncharacterized protein n=1 Tax=Batillaria attramentaria TaxID=370345 RepID=A0ABD0JM49_9CAEN
MNAPFVTSQVQLSLAEREATAPTRPDTSRRNRLTQHITHGTPGASDRDLHTPHRWPATGPTKLLKFTQQYGTSVTIRPAWRVSLWPKSGRYR